MAIGIGAALLGGSLIGGIGSALGGIFGAKQQADANKQNLREADINRQWQREYAHNQHQWQVADLKKAGLNPILSANSGISAPGGSMGRVESTAKDMAQNAGIGSQMALAGSQSAKNLADALRTLKTTPGAEETSNLQQSIIKGLKTAVSWSGQRIGHVFSGSKDPFQYSEQMKMQIEQNM